MTQNNSNEVFSSTGLVYYELTDLKEIIDNAVPDDVDDLNGYEFDPKDKAEIVKAADSIIRSGKVYLTNHFPFAGSFGMNVRTFCSFDLQAPAAANVTQRGLGTYLNVMYNPLWMVYKLGKRSEGVFLVVDTGNETADRSERFYNVAALLYHEYSHLLWNHLDVYRYYFENGYGNVANIATDCQINQDEFVANNKSLTDYGITLESTKKLTQNANLKAKESSWYYFQAIMKKMSQVQQQGNSGQQNQGQQNQQNQNNSNQAQGQNNGSSQNQSQQSQQGNGQNKAQTQQGQGQNQSQTQQSQSNGSNQSQSQQSQTQSQQGNGSQQNQNQDQQRNGSSQAQDGNDNQNQQGQSGQGQDKSQQQNQDQQGNGQGNNGQQSQAQNQQGKGNGQQNPMNPNASHNAWFNIPDDVKSQMKDEAGNNKQKQGNSGNGSMHSDGLGQEDHIADKDAMTAKIADAIRKAMKESHTSAEEMKSRGLASGEMIDAAMSGTSKKGKLPIKSVIQKGAGRLKFGSHRTYSRVNHHQGNRINILRGVKEDNHKNVNVFVDNSGSMSDDEINFAIGEIAAVAFKIKANLEVIPFDAEVYPEHKQKISKKGSYTYEPVGRGGTAFQPIFDYEKDNGATNQNDLIIILSDGYGESEVDTHGLRNIVYILVEETEDTLSVKNPIGQVAWLSNDNKYKLHKMTNR